MEKLKSSSNPGTQSALKSRYHHQVKRRSDLEVEVEIQKARLRTSLEELDKIVTEGSLMESSLLALRDVKPLLSANSIEQCEKLANAALSAIFETSATLEYCLEDGRFHINEGDYDTDLKEANGGGYLAVISFIFNIFLLKKMDKRLFLVFDEHFTQISNKGDKKYFDNFFEFLNSLSRDLGLDILLITHDDRISADMVNHIYTIEDGKAIKEK